MACFALTENMSIVLNIAYMLHVCVGNVCRMLSICMVNTYEDVVDTSIVIFVL